MMMSKVINLIRNLIWRLMGVYKSVPDHLFNINYLSDSKWVQIGQQTYDNGALIWRYSNSEALKIGKYCSIAHGVEFVCGAGHHSLKNVSTYPLLNRLYKKGQSIMIGEDEHVREVWDDKFALSNGPILIGNDVWIGLNAIIIHGVSIGDGAVILAGAVVTDNIPAYAIAGGIPAKIIGYRFAEQTIKCLQKISWWDWPEDLIRERISDFYSDVDFFVEKYSLEKNG